MILINVVTSLNRDLSIKGYKQEPINRHMNTREKMESQQLIEKGQYHLETTKKFIRVNLKMCLFLVRDRVKFFLKWTGRYSNIFFLVYAVSF